jgi:hypothetical protein
LIDITKPRFVFPKDTTGLTTVITLLYRTSSNIFENTSNEGGLQLQTQDFSPYLCTGLTAEYDSHSGKAPLSSEG